jgi:hypothetical protein
MVANWRPTMTTLKWKESNVWADAGAPTERLTRQWRSSPGGTRMQWTIIEYAEDDYRVSLGQVGPNFEVHGHYLGRGNTGGRDIWKSRSLQDSIDHCQRQEA